MNDRHVVVTGLGPVSALGIGREAFFDGVRENQSPFAPVSGCSMKGLDPHLAAEVQDFDVEDFLESQKAYLDRASEYAYAAMGLAIEDGNVDMGAIDRDRTGLMLGSAYGNLATMRLFYDDFLKKGPRLVKPFLFPHTYSNTTISLLAMEYELRGPHLNFSGGGVAGLNAIIGGFHEIQRGSSDLVFAGAFDALNEMILSGQAAMGRLSTVVARDAWHGPFDAKSDGTILGEGACILLLEERGHAEKRGARIYGEIDSVALAGGPGDGRGITQALTAVLAETNTVPNWLCVDANGCCSEDGLIGNGIAEALGNQMPAVPVSSIQPLTGEALGVMGAFQCAAALSAMDMSYIPCPANPDNAPLENRLNFVKEPGIEGQVDSVLVLSTDSGGSAGALMIEKAPGHTANE